MSFFSRFSYIPLLALKPAEMAALEELPEKDKNLLLPLIHLKRWSSSKNLSQSLDRIKKSFSNREWIATIDMEYLLEKSKEGTPELEIIDNLKHLSKSDNGYKNWVDFILENENLIPVLQFSDLSQLEKQIDNFIEIKKPVVALFKLWLDNEETLYNYNKAINILIKKKEIESILFILDYGDLDRKDLLDAEKYIKVINRLSSLMPKAVFSISGTSFPYSFSGSYKGEIPIYERQIFNRVSKDLNSIKIIYSDRASTRTLSQSGGSGTPPPRIDYPLPNDWRFVRRELLDEGKEKEILYKEAAQEVVNSDYWIKNLRLWGTQMIEKTCLGDSFGITSANRATAVRINLHLFQQLHYFEEVEDVDTEDDWTD